MGPAEIIGAGLAIGQSLDAVEDWPRRIGAVTATAVDAASRALFLPRNSAPACCCRSAAREHPRGRFRPPHVGTECRRDDH